MTHSNGSKRNQPVLTRREALVLSGGLLLSPSVSASTFHNTCSGCGSLPFDKYAQYDALGLAELVRKKVVKPEELLETAIARAEAVNPKINAITVPLYDQARQEVQKELPNGPFIGVPFLVKDLGFLMKGVRCTEGSRLFADQVPTKDDPVIESYRKAGLVLFGRTHSPEFGLIPTCESALHGVTKNPWNQNRTPGGSSGGSAAAIATGIVPMASGSDGGGSIRIPASCCGLFGLKPSRERIPLGLEELGHMVCVHVLTRTVRDSAAMLDVTAKQIPGYTNLPRANPVPFLEEVKHKPGSLKIALILRHPWTKEIHPQCQLAVHRAEKLLTGLGHKVKEETTWMENIVDWSQYFDDLLGLWSAALALALEEPISKLKSPLKDELEPSTQSVLKRGLSNKAVQVTRARRTCHQVGVRMAEFQYNYDIVMTPTLACLPVEHGTINLRDPDHNKYLAGYKKFCPFTILANCTGQPAMSVPLHWTGDNLPVGVQFLGRYGDEATLFRLAAQLEREQPWAHKRPPL